MAPLTPPGLPLQARSRPVEPFKKPSLAQRVIISEHRLQSEFNGRSPVTDTPGGPIEPSQFMRLANTARLLGYEIDILIQCYEATGPGSNRLVTNAKIINLIAQHRAENAKFDINPALRIQLLGTLRYRINLKKFALGCANTLEIDANEDYYSFSYMHWRLNADMVGREVSAFALEMIEVIKLFPAPGSPNEGCPFRKPMEYLAVVLAKRFMCCRLVVRALFSKDTTMRRLRRRIFPRDTPRRQDSGIGEM